MSEIFSRYSGRLDEMAAAAGAVIGIVVVFLLLIVAPDYTSTGVALTIACVIYLLLARRGKTDLKADDLSASSPRLTIVLNILFLICLSYSFITLYVTGDDHRPLGYFISTAFMGLILALEILFTPETAKGRSTFILIKILILALSLRWSLFYIFPESYFGTDPWRNAVIYNSILETGHISPEIGGYFYMPMHFVMVVSTSQLTGMAVREAMIFSLGFFEIISLSFIFLLARDMFNTKIGLLSTLILGLNSLHILWGWWLVGQTLGITLVAPILYFMLGSRVRGNTVFRAIFILVLIMLLLSHALSPFVVLVVLAISYLGDLVYRFFSKTRTLNTSINTVILFTVLCTGYWMFLSHFFDSFVRMLLGTTPEIIVPTSFTILYAAGVNQAWLEVNKLGLLIFYGLAIIGILSILNFRNIRPSGFNLAFCGLGLTGVIFLGFFFVDVEVLIGRWFVFMGIVLAVPAALGLVTLSDYVVLKWRKISVFTIIIFILTFLMITDSSSFDSPLYPASLKHRSALTKSELASADTLANIYPGTILTDWIHILALENSPETSKRLFFRQELQSGFLEMDTPGLLVLRDDIINNFPVASFVEPSSIYQGLERHGFNEVYDNGTVHAFYP